MNRHTVTKVGDVSTQIRGVTYASADARPDPAPGFVPILRAGNIQEAGLRFDDLVYVPEAHVAPRQHLQQDDVLIATSSGSISVLGKAGRVSAAMTASFGAFCKVLRPSQGIDPGYFAHFFGTTDYRRKMAAVGAGANINNLRSADLDELEIRFPPLDEQRRIARILDSQAALLRSGKAALDKVGVAEAAIVELTFGLDHTTDKEIGPSLDFLTSGSRGWAAYYADDGDLFLRIQNVRRNELILDDVAYVNAPSTKEADRTRVGPGDVLLSITADLGRTAVVPANVETAYINQHLAVLRAKRFSPTFLSAGLSSKWGQAQLARRNREGVKAGLNFDDVRSVRLPMPSRSEQEDFAVTLGRLSVVRSQLRRRAEALSQLGRSLSDRAYTGRL